MENEKKLEKRTPTLIVYRLVHNIRLTYINKCDTHTFHKRERGRDREYRVGDRHALKYPIKSCFNPYTRELNYVFL